MGEQTLTTGQFLALLYEKVLFSYGYVESELFDSGKREGWLTEMDGMSELKPLSRGAAARILHEILRRVMKEAEEEDWSAATELVDLYDCHRCVQHIAQVYAKGIMTAVEGLLAPHMEIPQEKIRFGGEDSLLSGDAALAIERLLHPEKRILPKREAKMTAARKLDRAEAENFLQTQEKVLAVDVGRDTGSLEVPHMIQLPMMKILENPFLLEPYRDYVLLLYCNGGYQSELAANCLLEHGYPKVFYFGLEKGDKRKI